MERVFPILASGRITGLPTFVPWWFVEQHREQAMDNHSQTLERLADRGGLGWVELYFVVTDKPFPFGTKYDARACALRVIGLIDLQKTKQGIT